MKEVFRYHSMIIFIHNTCILRTNQRIRIIVNFILLKLIIQRNHTLTLTVTGMQLIYKQ